MAHPHITAQVPAFYVQTRDVDGASTRKYRTLDGAIKRFEEMYGHTVGAAIADVFYDRETLPRLEELPRLRVVSDYGTVVIFFRRDA